MADRAPRLFALALLALPSVSRAQNATHIAPGESLATTRAFSSARVGDNILVAFIDDAPNARGELRTALLQSTPGGLDRTRTDASIAPRARTLSLAWNGSVGALAYIVPPLPPAPLPPGTFPHRFVSVPPSPTEPLGARNSSGGEIVVQRLDARGAPVGRPIAVFTENSRAVRVAVALENERIVVAWTGAAYTDNEVRGTVRAMRLSERNEARSFASSSGWFGDTGDALRIAVADGHTRVLFTGLRCVTREGSASPEPFAHDPSERVELTRRSLQPQASITLDAGPAVDCGPLSVHASELRADDTFGFATVSQPIARDALALSPGGVIASLGAQPGALALLPFALGPTFRPLSARAPSLPLGAHPHVPPPREHSPPEFEPAVHDAPTAPNAPAEITQAMHDPIFLDAAGAEIVSLPTDHRRVLFATLAPNGQLSEPAELFHSATLMLEAAVLAGTTPWVLAREGTWSGALRLLSPTARVAPESPVAVDPAWAALFTRVRTQRAIFMRFENSAGAMAARPEAPTDPRMPGIIASRNRLRARWTSLCEQLQNRAHWLSRHDGPADVLQATRQVCQIHGDLELGVPVDPSL